MGGILLIDAEQPFADNLAGSLKGRGFQVKLLDDGKDGLDFAKDSRPDLIVLCVELPKMSGYSICNKLKKDNDLKNIPLIITSKEATPETFAQHKKLKTRAEDYLIKPFSDGELIDKIGSLIALPSGGAAAPAPAVSESYALESLGAELDLGPSAGGGESAVRLDDDLASFDVGDASASLGLSPDDDALLASLDDLGKSSAPGAATADESGLDDLELPSVKDDCFDDAFNAIAPEPVKAAPPPRPEPPKPVEPARAPPPPRTETPRPTLPSTSAADLQQLSQLRRESSDLKAKVAELESKLHAADDSIKARDAQLASAGGGGGAGSSARELLALKEQLRAKDKEMDALRDGELEKDKALVELQEQLERAQAEAQSKGELAREKDAELSGLRAKVDGLTGERDQLEEQVNNRLANAENEREELRGQLEAARADAQKLKGDLERSRQHEDRLKMDVDRAKVDAGDERKAKIAAEAKAKEHETEARAQEERAMKAYQRLKTEETVREKAKKAVEIAFTLLNGDVDTGAKDVDLDIDQLDAE